MACKFRYKNSKIWWLKWYSGGKAYYESTHSRDRATAEYLLAKKQQELTERHLPAALRNINFAHALREYLEYCQAKKTKKTVRTDKYYLEGYFKACPMPHNLRQFDAGEFERHINSRVNALKILPITGNGWLRAFKTFFSWCVDRDYLDRNPLVKIKSFRIPEGLPKYLSKDEIVRLLSAAEGPTKLLVATAIYAGLRREELLFLEWKDIDFEKNTIWVVNKPGFTTKSKKPRKIPLHPALKSILDSHRQDSGLCFGVKALRWKFEDLCTAAKVKCNLHALRHTFGAYCALSGVPLPVLRDWMGHSSIKTTMIYAKLKPNADDGQMEKVSFS